MGLLCVIFGHKPPVYKEKGWWSPGEEYGRLTLPHSDNIGRVHCCVIGECARCGAKFRVARVHLTGEAVKIQLEADDRVSRKRPQPPAQEGE